MKFAYRVTMGLAALAASLVVGHGAAVAASAEKGKNLFVQHGCWQCHGFRGQGSVASSGGKVLAPDPLPWEAFSAFVRSTNRAMPPPGESGTSLAGTAACDSSAPGVLPPLR